MSNPSTTLKSELDTRRDAASHASSDAANSGSNDVLRNAVGTTCQRLQGSYFSNPTSKAHHAARASLAQLRRSAGADIESSYMGLANVLFEIGEEFDAKLAGNDESASPPERAAYNALTLFAIHMQSAKTPVHVPTVSFATACGHLHALSTSKSIKPRVDAMLFANSEKARVVHIRSLVALLRDRELGFDYGLLARDLCGLGNPKTRPGVQLRWGRDFALGYVVGMKNQDEAPNEAPTA